MEGSFHVKVGLNLNQPRINNKIKFEGYKPVKSDYGDREYEFNYVFDDSKKDCYLEIFLVDKDSNGNYFITGDKDENGNYIPLHNYSTKQNYIKLDSNKATRVDLAGDYYIEPNQAFAYHYVLRPKNDPNGIPEYKIDPGNVINDIGSNQYHKIYNVISDRVSTSTKGGAMKLILPDNNNVMWIYDDNNQIIENPDIERARKTNKNFANKIGGSIAGIEKDLDDGKLDNFTRIITTPLFADDSLTAHGYWNKNCYQIAHSLGNINNYSSLQRKMFKKGINLVSDGAYVNEGLEGVHFRHVLQWGKKSPYFNWFRISGLQDSPLNLGVFGKQLRHVTHRVINSKYKFEQNNDGTVKISPNRNYKSNRPTLIQIYDDRLVNVENLNEQELIKAYDKLLENNLDINNHNDSVVPYSFKINPEIYKNNVIRLNNYNKSADKKIRLYSGEGTRAVSQFEFFGLGGKHESGFETWDANPDIAKLNFVPSHYETMQLKNIRDPKKKAEFKKLLQENNASVQDYAISSAKYWTKKTNDILKLYTAQQLRGINNFDTKKIAKKIDELVKNNHLPKTDVNETIIQNVINGNYNLVGNDTESNYEKAILQGLMNTPLDSIEVGDDIVSVLASPFMTKRAIKPDQIGLSRYDSYIKGNKHVKPEYAEIYNKTDKLYKEEISRFASSIVSEVEKNLSEKLKDKNGNTTPYGKYVIPLLTSEIVRFAIIKGVEPKSEFKYDKQTGEISYDYKKTKSTSLLGMGIIANSPEDEAISLINKIKLNLGKISQNEKQELVDALSKSLSKTNYKSFALADMLVSRAQAGLDWRIDATKDIADIESIRNGKTNFEYTWDRVIEFWAKFTDEVKKYHPDAYFAAEVTDEGDIYNKGQGNNSGSRYSEEKEVNKKLLNETGFTTIANYKYLSSNINQIFGKLFDYNGSSPEKGLEHGNVISEQLSSGNFLGSGPLESIIYSYTFAGNHDKCRTIEGYAVDMDMVYTDLTKFENNEYRKRAYKILQAFPYGTEPSEREINSYDYSRVSPINIAKCESISSGMGKAINNEIETKDRQTYLYGKMLDALKNISNGNHKGNIFEAEGFGTKDFDTALDIVLDEMNFIITSQNGEKISQTERKNLKNRAFEYIVDPAISKYLGHIKFLTALVGNPTLFAGDDYASTGFETTTKNIYLQNRNIIREDWADPKSPAYKEFVKRAKDYIDYQFSLRKRPELQPLNDGTPYMLNNQKAYYNGMEKEISALLRQSPNGKITVSLFNTEGLTHKYDEYYRPARITLNCIDLNSNRKNTTISGLRAGMKFRNANNKDDVYYVNDKNQITGPDGKPITFDDSVLILYLDDNLHKQPSFTGRRVMYNPQYNIVSNPYYQREKVEIGRNLQLLSR